MSEDRIAYLCNIASNLTSNSETFKTLRSYYLMRCIELTKGYGLPEKHFSTKVRCPHCRLEWTRDTEVKVQPIKLHKRQRKKIKSQMKTEIISNNLKSRTLLNRNEMVQVCSFCKQSTTTHLIKPEKEYNNSTTLKELKANNQKKQNEEKVPKEKNKITKGFLSNTKLETNKGAAVNVYSNAIDVFSLKNEKNTLSSAIKEPIKVIKNNKKKRDKFAGLCQKAVLASAKLRQHKITQEQIPKNKLNLFLKPSSG